MGHCESLLVVEKREKGISYRSSRKDTPRTKAGKNWFRRVTRLQRTPTWNARRILSMEKVMGKVGINPIIDGSFSNHAKRREAKEHSTPKKPGQMMAG